MPHAAAQVGNHLPEAGIGRPTKPVGSLATGEVRVDFARMHHAVLGDEFAYGLCLVPARRRPCLSRNARMHKGMSVVGLNHVRATA